MKLPFLSQKSAGPEFVYPARPASRTAVIHPRLQVRKPHQRIHPDSENIAERISTFKPEAIAATLDVLLEIAGTIDTAVYPQKAVIVFCEPGQSLTAAQRDLLWKQFEVPIFMQLISADGVLLATECEAHNGLHVQAGCESLFRVPIQDGLCDCGAPAKRMSLSHEVAKALAKAAAA